MRERMKTESELLAQFQADNLRLVARHLRDLNELSKLRRERKQLKRAFANYVLRMEGNFTVGVLDYRCRGVLQVPAAEVTDQMITEFDCDA